MDTLLMLLLSCGAGPTVIALGQLGVKIALNSKAINPMQQLQPFVNRDFTPSYPSMNVTFLLQLCRFQSMIV